MIASGPTSQTFISQRLKLNYCDWGNPEKPPLVLVRRGCALLRAQRGEGAQVLDGGVVFLGLQGRFANGVVLLVAVCGREVV